MSLGCGDTEMTFCVLTLNFTLFHIIKKFMFITQWSTPTYFFGTVPLINQTQLNCLDSFIFRRIKKTRDKGWSCHVRTITNMKAGKAQTWTLIMSRPRVYYEQCLTYQGCHFIKGTLFLREIFMKFSWKTSISLHFLSPPSAMPVKPVVNLW